MARVTGLALGSALGSTLGRGVEPGWVWADVQDRNWPEGVARIYLQDGVVYKGTHVSTWTLTTRVGSIDATYLRQHRYARTATM